MKHLGLLTFFIFLTASLAIASERDTIRKKDLADWVTDLSSLAMHFFVIPALQITIVYGLMDKFAPQWANSVTVNFWQSLTLYLILDYSWYWNHRAFHSHKLPFWNLHKTHHAPEHIDVFVTSRNALITHFLMVYFWFVGVATYVLDNPQTFLAFATIGVVINFWGHTSFSLPCNSLLNKIITPIIVTPREHLWHHSRENPHCNFGTVFSFWDRWHGTFYCKTGHPDTYGETYRKTVLNQLLWPF